VRDETGRPGPVREEPGHAGDAPEEEARTAAVREEILERAHGLGDEGDFEGMARELRDSLEELPGDPFLLCWLGVAERELGLEGIAYERFKQALAADTRDPFVLATAGNALAGFDDPEAEGALRSAALFGKEVPLARWMYGAYLTREGMLDQGRAELEAARDLDPEDPVIRYELGVNLLLSDRPEEGLDSLFTAAEYRPEDGWTRVVLGLALLEEERLEEAGRELEIGARLREHDPEAQFLAALALAALGDLDSGWEMLERGRINARGTDALVADAVEERVEAGPEAALHFLRQQLGPSAYRERLGERP
jgi:tetratricopeptide (TPR) repeat protein